MSVAVEFLTDCVAALRSEPGLEGVVFLEAFQGKRLPNPMEKVHVSLEIVRNDYATRSLNGYFGKKDEIEQYGTCRSTTLGLHVYLPLGMCPSESDAICGRLEQGVRRYFGGKKCQIGAISYDRETRALRRDMEILLPVKCCVMSKIDTSL